MIGSADLIISFQTADISSNLNTKKKNIIHAANVRKKVTPILK